MDSLYKQQIDLAAKIEDGDFKGTQHTHIWYDNMTQEEKDKYNADTNYGCW